MEIYYFFCHLIKFSYFHEVFISPFDCIGCFLQVLFRVEFFHLDLIVKYIKVFTVPGKMWYVFNKCQAFRQR